MESSGSALMGIGRGSGEGRALEAAKYAVNSPLLETSINGASGIIMNITGGPDMTLLEVQDAANIIHEAVSEDAIVHFGAVINDKIQGEIQITVIATGSDLKRNQVDAFAQEKAEEPQFKKLEDYFNSSTVSNAEQKPQLGNILDIPDFLKK
jgi:cell division protein FtsZ